MGLGAVVKILLEAGADVNAHASYKWKSVLHAASMANHEHVVTILLDAGTNIEVYGGMSGTALYTASDNGHEQVVVRTLLNRGANLNAQGGRHGSALQAALNQGHKQVVRVLLDKGADMSTLVKQDPRKTEILLTDIKVPDTYATKWTAIQTLAYIGFSSLLESQLDDGADLNHTNELGRTALFLACTTGSYEVAKMLLDKGADVNIPTSSNLTALHVASECGNLQVVKLLLDNDADLAVRNTAGETSICLASRRGHIKTLELLLEKGAYRAVAGLDVIYGTVANMLAFGGYTDLLHFVVEHNSADLHGPDFHDRKTIDYATIGGHPETIQYLINQGLTLSVSNGKGYHLLDLAASGGSLKVIDMIL